MSLALFAFPSLLLGRAVAVTVVSGVANMCRPAKQRITGGMQVLLCISCIRGAVPFALAVSLDDKREAAARPIPN